ncbi:hypothetical protein KPL70_014158 [Citrus sinensis]|nr:hypothetical protein KPL70_014158 [Citrus sinensis]
MLLMAYADSNDDKNKEAWFLDLGCSNHMSGSKEWFTDIDEQFRQSVKLGNDTKMAVKGRGNVKFQVNGITQVITNVYYVPELKNNLLSIGQLQEKGVTILIKDGVCGVYHPRKGLIMQTTMSTNRMFVILVTKLPTNSTCFQAISEDNTHLWHCRYGHLSFKGLKTLQHKEMVKGLPVMKMSSKLCIDCMIGKQHRKSIPKKSLWRATHKLQLVHSDLCRPITPASSSGKSPTLVVKDKTPEEAWSNHKPTVHYFRVFGCVAHVLGRSTKAAKLDVLDWGESEEESNDDTFEIEEEEADPTTFEEANKSARWRKAMDQEMAAIEKNNTWELTTLPVGAKTIGVKWIFKTKLNENGDVEKYKARLVAKGYAQQYGIDYKEVFAPVALYVDQPQGYVKKGDELKVYKLKKTLYGLKQAPQAWYSRIEAYLFKQGFERCPHEHTLFVKQSEGGNILIISLYVDDLIFTGNNESMFEEFKKSMEKEFDMSDLGKMRYFIGVEVVQNENGIYLSQKKYAKEVLDRFGMRESHPSKNPIIPGCKLTKDENGVKVDETEYKQDVGCLMYLAATRPDLMYVLGLVSRYMGCPTELHMQAVKRVLRYLRGTMNLGLQYKRNGTNKLEAFTDSDYVGDLDDRRSTSGHVFMLSSCAVSWSSKKQPVVTLSTTKAEFIAAASCACQGVWMRSVLEKLGHAQNESTVIHCDNNSTIKLSKNPVLHGRSKHIDIRFHFLRDLTKDGTVKLVYCSTQNQIADIMTKPLKLEVFEALREGLGMCRVPE